MTIKTFLFKELLLSVASIFNRTSKSSFKFNLLNAAYKMTTPVQAISNIAVISILFSFAGK
jgi:hypothetical protein